jgi:hypothetical protein
LITQKCRAGMFILVKPAFVTITGTEENTTSISGIIKIKDI